MHNFFFRFLSVFKKTKEIFYIENNDQFMIAKEVISKERLLGLDTEFDWRNTYFPVLSMLQISTPKCIFLFDCLNCKNIDSLKCILEDENKIIIFHAARSDTTVLSTNLNIKIKKAFDIQVAEKLLNSGDIKSYSSIVLKYFGEILDKSETNSNWLRRPLNQNQISYAASDVEFLLDIFKFQKKNLLKINKLNNAFELSQKEAFLGNKDIKLSRLDRNKDKLSRREREIFLWREDMAKLENIPTSFLFKDKYLKKLSRLKGDDSNLKSQIIKILGDTKLTENFISNFF